MKAIIVCGDRNWTDQQTILDALEREQPDLVIHGGADGADSLAGIACVQLEIRFECYPARWQKYGRAAGPVRNELMLDRLIQLAEEKDWQIKVVAFHGWIQGSKGTKNMVQQARKARVPVVIIAGRQK